MEDQDIERNETRFAKFKSALEKANIHLLAETKVLEIGSGTTEFLNYLRNEGVDAVGVDFRPRGTTSGVVVAARIEQLPFPNESFDAITSTAVFDAGVYDQDQKAMIAEIARVHKPEGAYVSRGDEIEMRSKTLKRVAKQQGKVPIAVYKKAGV